MFDILQAMVDEFSIKYSNGQWTIDTGKNVSHSPDLKQAVELAIKAVRTLEPKPMAHRLQHVKGVRLTGNSGKYYFCGREIEVKVDGEVWTDGGKTYVGESGEKGDNWLVQINGKLFTMSDDLLQELCNVWCTVQCM